MGFSLPNLTGCNGKTKCEKVDVKRGKYLIIDELTLIDTKVIDMILNDETYNDYFIFLLGDVDEDGKYYQCSISDNIILPNNYNLQYTKYNKSFRFDDELNIKLDRLREQMINLYNDDLRNVKIQQFVKAEFNKNFVNKEDIIFNNDDI